MLYYLLSIIIIGFDQLTKWLIVKFMELGESIPVIENLFYITSHRNRGAAWGILQGQMWLFYLITVIVVIFIIYYLQKYAKGKPLYSISLAFMLGGAVGNFIDRLFRKEVVDFIDVKIFGYDFPIFNIADSSLTIGVILLIITMFFEERKEKKEQ
ncbi:signal peptidase II [Caldifermentibacillus hisashii]|uniref:signal peptidase II n=1 Tax=Caldifermentibacillus hisashii TaxID=996558 RepID=UPI003100C333